MMRRIPAFLALRNCVATIAAAAIVGACGSVPQAHFHTLLPPPSPAVQQPVATGPVAWEVLPVTVPAQVDQPQWVVRAADGSLVVLEQERWAAPLGEEIRAAVAERLTSALGAPEPAHGGAQDARRWRVRIDVQRFDTVADRTVRLEAVWTVRSGADGTPMLSCRGEFAQTPATGTYAALAQGHRQNVIQLAELIARALKAMDAGQSASCSG